MVKDVKEQQRKYKKSHRRANDQSVLLKNE